MTFNAGGMNLLGLLAGSTADCSHLVPAELVSKDEAKTLYVGTGKPARKQVLG